MLVTSSQISVAISSGIVCIFTTLLFLSGYVLQQQTVRSLQAAIHPKVPVKPVPTVNPVLAKHFGRPPGHSFYDKYLASNRPKGGWAKVAYVQLLRSHTHVCNAVMVFAALEEQESMAQRILMYPREWDDVSTKSRAKATSQRLLRDAATQYKVMLQAIDVIPQARPDNEGQSSTFSDEENYPMTNLLSLINFNRLIYLQPSGLIVDVTPLDLLFTLPMDDKHMLGLSSSSESSADRPAILLIEPSKMLYQEIAEALPEGAYPDLDFWSQVPTMAAPPQSKSKSDMILAESSSLHTIDPSSFNASAFLETTGYIHFQDNGTMGPEYDTPRQDFARAAPREEGVRRAWYAAYRRYGEIRMDVCGLDLEAVHIETVADVVDKVEVNTSEVLGATSDFDPSIVLPGDDKGLEVTND